MYDANRNRLWAGNRKTIPRVIWHRWGDTYEGCFLKRTKNAQFPGVRLHPESDTPRGNLTLVGSVFYTTCRQMIPGIIHRVGSKYTLKIRLLPEVTPKRGVFWSVPKTRSFQESDYTRNQTLQTLPRVLWLWFGVYFYSIRRMIPGIIWRRTV